LIRAITLSLVAATGLARADSTPPEKDPPLAATIRLRGVSAHQAARFVARGFHANYIIVGSDAPIDLAITTTSVDDAIAAVARAAGLETRRWGNTFLIGPGPVIAAALPSKATRHDRNIDVDFYRVSVEKLQKLLADVAKMPTLVDGTSGEISMVIRNRPASEVADWIEKLAGDGKALPPVKPTAHGVSCEGVPERAMFVDHLRCVPLADVELLGTFVRGEGKVALVRQALRVTEANRSLQLVPYRAIDLRIGDHLADPPVRVLAITPDAVDLEGPQRLSLRR
jgi:hypothetical protein